MVVARVEQLGEQKTGRIIGVVDVIRSAEFVGVEGLEDIEPQDAFAVFRDESRSRGEQEIRISMENLAKAYYAIITLGELNEWRWIYSLRVGGQEMEVDASRVFALAEEVYRWRRAVTERALQKIGECRFKPS